MNSSTKSHICRWKLLDMVLYTALKISVALDRALLLKGGNPPPQPTHILISISIDSTFGKSMTSTSKGIALLVGSSLFS